KNANHFVWWNYETPEDLIDTQDMPELKATTDFLFGILKDINDKYQGDISLYIEDISEAIVLINDTSFKQVYNYNGDFNIDWKNPSPQQLLIIDLLLTFAHNFIGKEKTFSTPSEFLKRVEIVSTIIEAIEKGFISTLSFIAWTKGKKFEMSVLHSPISLNPQEAEKYGEKYLKHLSDALFTLASYMDYLLKEFDHHNLDTAKFNFVYGLHSLRSDYQLHRDYQLAGVLFMIISSVKGDFKKKFNVRRFTQSLPVVYDLIIHLQTNPQYIRALNFFHNLGIPYVNNFNLNPEQSRILGFEQYKNIGDFLFTKASLIKEGYFEDALSLLEITYKMYVNWDLVNRMLERNGERKISFVADKNRIGFDYRILGGILTIFMYDQYQLRRKYHPVGIAKLAVSFVVEGRNLEEVKRKWIKDSDMIKKANKIAIITLREDTLDRIGAYTHHHQLIFLPNRSLFCSSYQTYDVINGRLMEEVIEDKYRGYRILVKPDWSQGEWIFYDQRRVPLHIPRLIRTYVEAEGRLSLLSRAVNKEVDFKREIIRQAITFYTPKAPSYTVERIIGLARGEIFEEINREESTHIYNTYNSSFLQVLGIATQSVKYDFKGNILSEAFFEGRKGFKVTSEGVRVIFRIKDQVTGLKITQEKDFLGKLYREKRENHLIHRERRFYFDNPFLAGFGVATHSSDFDLSTGLKISASKFLRFNVWGGVTFKTDKLIKGISKIVVFDGKGKILRIYEGDKVEFKEGLIYAQKVDIYSYEQRWWRARRIASKVERFIWDSLAQRERVLISVRSSLPYAIKDLTTYYGAYRVLEVEEGRPKLGMRMTIWINLINGQPVRIKTPYHLIDIGFNSLDIEYASRKMNLEGKLIEETTSKLDSLGRPLCVKDAGGRILKARLLKHLVNPSTGQEKDLIQRFVDGLVDIVLIYPCAVDKDIIWQVNIDYDEEEIEAGTQTIAYRNGRKLGQVKHTITDLERTGNGKLYKKEFFAIGSWQEYEQNVYSGLLNNIQIHTKINGEERVYIVERVYDELDIIKSWIMYVGNNRRMWVLKAERERISKENKEIYFKFIWSGAHRETAVLDVNTGLFIRYIYDVEYQKGRFARWITLIKFDELGIEKERNIYVDINRDGKISEEEKSQWVLESKREKIDKTTQTVLHRYKKPNRAEGILVINTQVGKEIGGTIENVDMGQGLYEDFTYEIKLSGDLREIARITKNSSGETIIKAYEDNFDFGNHLSKIHYLTCWGEEGTMLIDTQSSFVRG
ncbi:MAG: hypothetical protein DRP76_03070, partial [Candidatus Omnitrophota bacterium]